MPTSPEAIIAAIADATSAGFRGKLIARGQARGMIWRDGVLPPEAPLFSPQLSYDLHSYAYGLLGLGLRLLDLGGDPTQARIAFEHAATALEAVMAKGNRTDSDRDFHFVIAAASYHLAHLSARAYSLLAIVAAEENFSYIEQALALLMRRDIDALRSRVHAFRLDGEGSDTSITELFQSRLAERTADEAADREGHDFLFEGLDLALTDAFFGALSMFLLALDRGERALVDRAIAQLREGLDICGELNLLPQWWGHRVAIRLLSDLWSSTFHEKVPLIPAGTAAASWPSLRELSIALLARRPRAEVDLWPSQTAAAARAVDQSDNLVVSLPTSAGKTRIAELAILRCLAGGRRVVFVTPLRALSAQTESTLQRTFGPLGKTISALYGSIGVSGFDEDAVRKRDIVVATPEKLDFALRNDPSLLDNVGLLIFDEGHMIGPGEREVRYEVQIQRLLRRQDAGQRRIVCLSAILPDGDQLEDFSAWLRRDQPGGPIKDDWRPTRLRFGEVKWNSSTARLNLRVGDERPFVPRFLTGAAPPRFVPPKKLRTRLFPDNQQELSLATAWRLVGDGQTVLIYCPERRSVEPFAKVIVDLHSRGALSSLLTVDPAILRTAIALGEEWLGAKSDILKCLRLGVALHHGALPTAYRKEIERLLRDGVLKVTISSPTLAQGLNLSATAVIMHSLYRHGEKIKVSEFKNVIGRAGRAYVDVEGIVLHPIFEDTNNERHDEWVELIEDLGARDLESGLAQLIFSLLTRMRQKIGGNLDHLIDYVVNNATAWTFPELPREKAHKRERALSEWGRHMATLDTAILGLIGEADVPDDQIEATLDNILQSSLWQRRLLRLEDASRAAYRAALLARSRYIWANSTAAARRGYFLAGLGLEAGHALDAIAPKANLLLVEANAALAEPDHNAAIEAITELAELVFEFSPFRPDPFPANWRDLLRRWLLGEQLAAAIAGQEADALQFIDGGLVYRLPWAMEALRVRAAANGDVVGVFSLALDDHELGLAVPALETGTMNRSASILIQAGFNSRLAAIKVVEDTAATFTNGAQLRAWLRSADIAKRSVLPQWPTAETRAMWLEFLQEFAPSDKRTWSRRDYLGDIDWFGAPAPPGTPLGLLHRDGRPLVVAADGRAVGRLPHPLNPKRRGVLRASVGQNVTKLDLSYLGPDDLWT
ncbi:DEAD/DEAH box helicase [Sinorhizobium meliloti]|uniref:DEAD/DEAH box helicase n=1 Tax=Rhizobium meliloti TaxID=382 RepID=UPI00237F7B0A|nr:DEAD/DEAH box helicase [Sinorhizobium meliloti]MDE3812296.1 DEAD/DEAH box helicase [Sinorhizobium meliloti]